jgi:signal peptidase I
MIDSVRNIPTVTVEDELRKNGFCIMNTSGRSMRPLIKENDAVVLKLPDREIRKYDVVLYTDKTGRHILHRVIGKRGNLFVIRGDNTFIKEFVPENNILAYMISFNRNGKKRDTGAFSYRFYSRIWLFIYPLRLVLRKACNLIGRIKRKFFK